MTRANTFTTETTLVTEECCACGVIFAMPSDLREKLLERKAGGTFYCPNGHPQHYTGQPLKEQLAEARRRLASAEEEARIERVHRQQLQREVTAARRRAKAALCPVPGCNRQIVQMSRHMHAKHPEFVHPETPT